MRSARTGLVLVVACACIALVFGSYVQYKATKAAYSSSVRGQLDLFLRALRRQPRTQESLDEYLEENHDQGLRYVSVVRPGESTIFAGTAKLKESRRHGVIEEKRGRVGITTRLPPRGPRPDGRRAKAGRGAKVGKRPPPPPHLRGYHVIEIVPVHSQRLRQALYQQIGAGLFTGVAMLLIGFVALRAMRREEEQARELEQQASLALVGEMSAMLAHEVRNPLASIKGHAQLLLEDAEGDAFKKRAKQVVSDALRLEVLTTDLLAFVKSSKIVLEQEDPVELVELVCESEPRIDIHIEEAPREWPFDFERMRLALNNLTSNALAAGDGRVSVLVRNDDEHLVFEVLDSGGGIEESVMDSLFNPLVTTRAQGTGLGLAVVKRVVDLHKGSVAAENREQGGARFTVRIPRLEIT